MINKIWHLHIGKSDKNKVDNLFNIFLLSKDVYHN